jgi:hypothetical protein
MNQQLKLVEKITMLTVQDIISLSLSLSLFHSHTTSIKNGSTEPEFSIGFLLEFVDFNNCLSYVSIYTWNRINLEP